MGSSKVIGWLKSQFNLTSDVTGTLPIGNGGTGQTTNTKGDIIAGNGSAWNKESIGANDTVLTADSTQTNGIKWATAGGATVTQVSDDLTTTFTTSSTSFVDITGLTLTVPNITGGSYIYTALLTTNAVSGDITEYTLTDDGTRITRIWTGKKHSNTNKNPVPLTISGSADGSVIRPQIKSINGTSASVQGSATDVTSNLECIGIG